MYIRKNAIRLPRSERLRFVNAIKALKADIVATLSDGTRVSRYDQIVALHLGVTARLINNNQIADGGHRGPAFLPWHRQYTHHLEAQLRQVDASVTLPYWDWTDRTGTRDVLFQDDFMGPAGSGPGPVGPVQSGHFTLGEGWTLINEIHRGGVNATRLGRELLRATRLDFNALPTASLIDQIQGFTPYEATFAGAGFRPELETGPHNQLHPWMGGSASFAGPAGTMSGMSSPNDPMFFLHHGAVDWMWARWQDNGHAGPANYPASVPPIGGLDSTGHALQQPMWPWDEGQATTAGTIGPYLPSFPSTLIIRPIDMLDFRALGFTYDTLLPVISIGQTIDNIQLDAPGDELGFQIVVQNPGNYRIETHGVTATVMTLHGPDSWELRLQDNGSGNGQNAMISANLNPGTYYAVVRHADPAGTGEFGISLQADIADDSIAITLDAPAVQASIGQGGEEDRYRFDVPGLGRYVIETQGPTDVVMSLYGPDSSQNLITQDDDGGQDRNARISSRLSAGSYFVRVRHYFPTGTGLYSILARTEAEETPTNIQVDGPEVQGEIGIANESDLYRFTVTQQGRYIIETSGTTDTFLTLLGPDDETAVMARDDDSGPGTLSRIEQALNPGTYFARVRHFSPSQTGPYGIRVSSV